jgi:putative addiction module CopG family antidote
MWLTFSHLMAATTMNVSLTPELRREVQRRVRSGRYGNASDVFRASLRALDREEMGDAWREWLKVKKDLPKDPITPEIEDDIVLAVRKLRTAEKAKARK